MSEPESFLPLRPLVFSILLLLKKEKLHGYAIMKKVNENAGKRVILGPGTLYRTLKEMRDSGLIDHAEPPRGGSSDDRRSYYALTPLGQRIVRAEAERIGRLLRQARLAPSET
jgi:DNA-binding PadR family transcriptional regulator